MRRRDLVVLLGGAMTASRLVHAQQPSRTYRIGFVAQSLRSAPQWAEVFDELDRAGFIEGKNLVVDTRGLGVGLDAIEAVVDKLIETSPDAIYCGGDDALRAAARATKTIPVIALMDDFLASGLIQSLAHPGGNLTGVSIFSPELDAKRIELLLDILPAIHRVAILADRRIAAAKNIEAAESVLRQRQIETILLQVGHEHEIIPALQAARAANAEAVGVLSSPLLHAAHARLLEFLAADRMPAIFQWPDYVAEGALAAYGPRILPVFRQIGAVMVKVLKGTKPADIPIEQPSKFYLAVNLKSAKSLRLTMPPLILARADEVIE